jgi:hypothetical protein
VKERSAAMAVNRKNGGGPRAKSCVNRELGVAEVATATQRRGWDTDSVTKEEKTDKEKTRAIRARQRAIGRELRRLYDNVAKEPVPSDFMELLHQIDGSGNEGGTSSS